MSRQTTLEIARWRRKYSILFQLCQGQSSVITAVLLTSKGCFISFIRLIKNIKLYCIYRCFNTQNYIYPFQNLSLGFILKIFLKFHKFQPRYSYKIYSYKKKSVVGLLPGFIPFSNSKISEENSTVMMNRFVKNETGSKFWLTEIT